MKPYQYYCDKVGLDKFAYKKQPEIKREFVIYIDKSPVIVTEQIYDTHKGAKEVIKNNKLHKEFWDKQREIEQQAIDLWLVDLRSEYTEPNDSVFNLCYANAYERGHSSGFDEVAMHMQDVVDFAMKVVKLTKN